MCKSFKSGFDFVVKIIDDGTDAKMLRLQRSNGSNCGVRGMRVRLIVVASVLTLLWITVT